MHGAEVVLAVNIAVAALFSAAYAIVALTAGQRRAMWFSLSYLIGLINPVSEFLLPFTRAVSVHEWLSYASFLAATLSISFSLDRYHGRPVAWRAIAAIFVGGLIVRGVIWDWPRASLVQGFAYQLPFALSSVLACRTARRLVERRGLHLSLAILFGAIAVHFMLKPFFAVSLGTGATLADYTTTTYALLSQAGTGVLLLASGLLVLLIVVQRAVSDSQQLSSIDPLSGLLNRRGFEEQAQTLFARAESSGLPVSAIMLDLDQFKRVNDRHGHQTGDRVLADFATLLRGAAPTAAVVGRMGGEEFALVIEGATAQSGWLNGEAIRVAARQASARTPPATTVSGGVAERQRGESLSDLLRRADQALYRAKREGRDRMFIADDEVETDARVIRFQHRR